MHLTSQLLPFSLTVGRRASALPPLSSLRKALQHQQPAAPGLLWASPFLSLAPHPGWSCVLWPCRGRLSLLTESFRSVGWEEAERTSTYWERVSMCIWISLSIMHTVSTGRADTTQEWYWTHHDAFTVLGNSHGCYVHWQKSKSDSQEFMKSVTTSLYWWPPEHQPVAGKKHTTHFDPPRHSSIPPCLLSFSFPSHLFITMQCKEHQANHPETKAVSLALPTDQVTGLVTGQGISTHSLSNCYEPNTKLASPGFYSVKWEQYYPSY